MQPKEDLEIVVNAPAISMEEVLPIAVSTHTQLAPEEVLAKGRREKKGDTELTDVCFLCFCSAVDVAICGSVQVLWKGLMSYVFLQGVLTFTSNLALRSWSSRLELPTPSARARGTTFQGLTTTKYYSSL